MTSDENWVRLTASTELEPGQRLDTDQVRRVRLVGRAVGHRSQGPGGRGADRRDGHGLGRAAGGAAGVPRRVLGPGRRRGGRRPRSAAGGAVRPVPPTAGERPGRAAGDPGQGPDRDRVRRARLLGDRGLRAPGADRDRARRSRRRPALAARHAADRQGVGAYAPAARRRLRLADDPRRGVQQLLAGRDGGVPRQRRHRCGGRPAGALDPGRGLRPRVRAAAAGRDGAAVAVPGLRRRGRAVPPRRRHRSGRVQRPGRRQHLTPTWPPRRTCGRRRPPRSGGPTRPRTST